MIKTIAIRNPNVIERVDEELRHGGGRNVTETAENMIWAECERRRVRREAAKTRRGISRRKLSGAVSGGGVGERAASESQPA